MYTRHRTQHQTQRSFRLPERLAEDTKLSSYAKQLALVMFSYAGQRTGRLCKSQRELARLSGLSVDTVNRKLRELEKARYLTVRRKRAKRDRETGRITRGASEYICMVPKKGYLLVPYRLLRRLCGLRIHGASVDVFLYVYRIMRDECAYPSFSKIREQTGLADSTVRSVVKVLDCVGLLYIRHCRKRNGAYTSNSYLLLHDAGYVCRPAQQTAPKPAVQRPCPNDRVFADIQNNKVKPKITRVLTREERIYRASILWDKVMMKIKTAAPKWHRLVKLCSVWLFCERKSEWREGESAAAGGERRGDFLRETAQQAGALWLAAPHFPICRATARTARRYAKQSPEHYNNSRLHETTSFELDISF